MLIVAAVVIISGLIISQLVTHRYSVSLLKAAAAQAENIAHALALDAADKIFIKREIQLSPDQRRLYDQMKKEAIAILKGKQSTTVNTLTQLMRLQQITCGHFTADDGATQSIANNRITELMDVLEETEGKAIIWAHYQYDITAIIQAVVKKYGEKSIVDVLTNWPSPETKTKFRSPPSNGFIS